MNEMKPLNEELKTAHAHKHTSELKAAVAKHYGLKADCVMTDEQLEHYTAQVMPIIAAYHRVELGDDGLSFKGDRSKRVAARQTKHRLSSCSSPKR